ncbi:hypothetical protein B0H10DRAFT_1967718 [Mycena sp. CBHHK59/15]|nr:hypothetical protein B0H10DRAFT_1967718 [Mycena sp. CBHHK59/15]
MVLAPSCPIALLMVGTARKKAAGLSSNVKIAYGKTYGKQTGNDKNIVTLNKTGTQIERNRQIFAEQIASLSFTQREDLFGLGHYNIEMLDQPVFYGANGWELDSDDEEALHAVPPGEEALNSHAGREHIFHKIFQKVKPGCGDPRKQAQRVKLMINAWQGQMAMLVAMLVDTYLELKATGPCNSDNDPSAWPLNVLGFDGMSCSIHTCKVPLTFNRNWHATLFAYRRHQTHKPDPYPGHVEPPAADQSEWPMITCSVRKKTRLMFTILSHPHGQEGKTE